MISEALRRARGYESERLSQIEKGILPAYHISAGTGWLNDPNGFSFYRGEYHLFFQYHPYSRQWGPMHWGHVKSTDLIRWERLPCAMAPDEPYDRDGCFSGSALALDDGRHLLMYTGVRKDRLPDGSIRERQVQCLAFGDGVRYEKYAGNPVIDASALPEGGSPVDFRDPKIWYENGLYHAVTGNRCPDGSGAVLLFESGDALHWRYTGTLAASRSRRGRMWECPDTFPLDGEQVLLVSPQEMRPEEPEFIEGNTTLCLIGTLGGADELFRAAHEQTIDCGLDFYAPQTTLSPDGRRVMIAWMQYWDSTDCPPDGLPFFGQLTVPRELSVRRGRLFQTPVRELDAYRTRPVSYADVPVSGETSLPGIGGRCMDLTVTIRASDIFTIGLARGGGYETLIIWDPASRSVCVDRSGSGAPAAVRGTRAFTVPACGDTVKLRMLLDRYSLELFVNDGIRAASFTLYTPREADGMIFRTAGTARIDVEKYDLEFE